MKPLRILFWGNRVGKTEIGAMEVARYLTNDHAFRDTSGRVEVWAACPSYDVQEETTQDKLLKYIPESAIKHISYIRGRIIKNITLKNNNRLTFKSYEQGREKFQGAGKRLIWFDEEPPQPIYEESFVRQEAGMQLDIIMTMTPVNGMTWVYDRLYNAEDKSDIFISEAGWNDNPYLLEKQKLQMTRGLSEDAIEVRRHGRFVSRVGLVCGWWNRETYLRTYDKYPYDWQYFECIDPGFSDPTAYLLIGVDPQANIHVLDGFRESELTADEVIKKRNHIAGNLTIHQSIGDNDNPRFLMQLRDLGMDVMPVKKVVREQGKNWDEFLAEILAYYGTQNRLFINSELSWLIQEIENLKWMELKRKDGIEVKPKWDDHRRFKHHFDGIRALAYLIASESIEPLEMKPKAPGHGKLKGTFIEPLITEEEEDSSSSFMDAPQEIWT